VCVFFFFQAEDGIRDWSVTGVQTCALPISQRAALALGIDPKLRPLDALLPLLERIQRPELGVDAERQGRALRADRRVGEDAKARSEERRVGKRWRWGRGVDH